MLFEYKIMFKWVPECLSPAFLKKAKQILHVYIKLGQYGKSFNVDQDKMQS